MRFSDIQCNNSTSEHPSDLVELYRQHDANCGSLASFLMRYEFDDQEEIREAVITLIYAMVRDAYMGSKYHQENDPSVRMLYKRFSDIANKADKIERYPRGIASELWGSFYSRHNLEERVAKMFSRKPNADAFDDACNQLRSIYNFSGHDLEKISFFVEQVKAGEKFPNSLRRMLYFWGETKKSGKTTCAKMITCILNGERNWDKVDKYSSNLANEMQIGGFKVPRISECNCVMMDECFYADMGKTYSDFKRFLTSSNGRARLPYGQEFEWQGMPNYIATSNDSLQKFIKDWNDRRYLSIEFKERPYKKMDFADIYCLWEQFIINSTPRAGWAEWSDSMFNYCEEKGERQEYADEFENELRQNTFVNLIMDKQYYSTCPTNNNNRITLKYFVDYFADHNPDARKRRSEIEAAVLKVFGQRYGGTNYWLLGQLREVAQSIQKENNGGGIEQTNKPF